MKFNKHKMIHTILSIQNASKKQAIATSDFKFSHDWRSVMDTEASVVCNTLSRYLAS